jgi:hypothetical protein
MAPVPHAIAGVIFLGAFIAWIVGVRHFIAISNELRRARQAGEASHIPKTGGRGLPIIVLISNALPRVEGERQKMLRALAVFVGFGAALVVLILLYGPHRP